MVCTRLTTLIVILLVFLQAMETFALNLELEDKDGDKLIGRKMMMMSTTKMPKSSEISGFAVRKNQLQRSTFDQTSNQNSVDEKKRRDFSSQNLESRKDLRVIDDLETLMNKDYHFENGKGRNNPPVNNDLPSQGVKP